MAQNKFKTGDRVYWKGNTFQKEDYGVVKDDWVSTKELPVDSIWVLWESDAQIVHIEEDSVSLVDRPHQDTITVENCLTFLISQGYTVTLSKN